MHELLYRGRLLILSSSAVAGGALGSGGRWHLLLLLLPVFLLLMLACARTMRRGLVFALAAAVLFLAAFLYCCQRERSLEQRRGASERVILVGRVEVSNRGGEESEGALLRVLRVDAGSLAQAGDSYLLRPEGDKQAKLEWGDVLMVEGFLRISGRSGGVADGFLTAREWQHLGSEAGPILRLAVALREGLCREAESRLPPREAALVEGIMLGDYRRLSVKDLLDLRSSGLIHVCAASGLHVGIMVSTVLWLGSRLTLNRRLLVFLQIPLVFVYALAAGFSVPVLRAALVVAVAGAALLTGRDFDFLSALGLAMGLLFLRDPKTGLSTSFQLSFAAALGVSLLGGPLREWMRAGRDRVRGLISTTLAAQLAVAPVLVLHFGKFSLLATVSNLLVLPILPILMGLTMLSTLLSAFAAPVAGLATGPVFLMARWIEQVAGAAASSRWAEVLIFPVSAWWMAAYYALLAAAMWGRAGMRRAARAAFAALLLSALISGSGMAVTAGRSGKGVRLTFMDVGQGDACLVEAPSGATVLVDGGKEERKLSERLRRIGVRYLDLVVVSHPEADHVGGLEGALEECGVGAVVCPAGRWDGKGEGFFRKVEEMGIPLRQAKRGDLIRLGELSMRVLGPSPELDEESPCNDRSLVLEVEGPGLVLVLPGDVEEEGQETLLAGTLPDCDVLKVPHHGGFVEGCGDFFARLRPEIAVISVGRGNPYGHPSRATLAELERIGCAVYRTDEHGDIVIVATEGGFGVRCER